MDVSVNDLRSHLNGLLERAQQGEEIIVTDQGIPVVRILGASATPAIEKLIENGVIGRPAAGSGQPKKTSASA